MTNEVIAVDGLGINMTPANVDVAGLDEMIAKVEERLSELNTLIIDENTEKYAKAERTKLNKMLDAWKQERISVGKAIKGNWETSEAKIKAVEKLISETAGLLGDGLNVLDTDRKTKKLKMVSDEVAKIATAHNIQSDKIEFNKSWLNKSYSWPKMQEEIETQAKLLETEQKAMLANVENIEMYAKSLELESAGFVAMLETGNDVATVRVAMDNAVQARKLQLEAKKAKQEEARRIHEEAVANAQTVGDKQVNVETGEVVEEWQEPTSTYQYTFRNMTHAQKEWLDTQLSMAFDSREIEFSSREV